MFRRNCVAQALSRGSGFLHLLHASTLYRKYDEVLIFVDGASGPKSMSRKNAVYIRHLFFLPWVHLLSISLRLDSHSHVQLNVNLLKSPSHHLHQGWPTYGACAKIGAMAI